MARLTIRVDLGKGGALGPGKIRLLELIQAHGSISEAGRVMGMSYRQAWLLVDSLNGSFRQAVVSKQTGGTRAAGRASLRGGSASSSVTGRSRRRQSERSRRTSGRSSRRDRSGGSRRPADSCLHEKARGVTRRVKA